MHEASQPCPSYAACGMIFRKIDPLIEVSRRAAIREDLEKLMPSVHEDSAWLRSGHSRFRTEVTAGDVGKDHISQGVGLFYSPKSLEKKASNKIQKPALKQCWMGSLSGEGGLSEICFPNSAALSVVQVQCT